MIDMDDSISRIRQVLLAKLEALVFLWAPALGIGPESLRDWIDGIVGEGIAMAIAQQSKWKPDKGDFLHWAFLKTKRLLRKELKCESRFRKARQALQEMAPLGNSRRNADALRDDLLEVLEQLPLEHQQALVLFYLHGMKADRLAEVLEKTPDAAYALLARARNKAQKLWKGLGNPTPSLPSVNSELLKRRLARSIGIEEERRKELELRAFVNRLFGLMDSPDSGPPRPSKDGLSAKGEPYDGLSTADARSPRKRRGTTAL